MSTYWKELEVGASTTEGATVARDNGMKSHDRVAETPPEQSFRDVLAAAIEVTTMTREELARRIGRSGAAVSQWLNKGDVPDLAIVFKLEDALDLRLGALVRHHSPDVWLIIEAKTGRRGSWKALSWEKKLQEALIEAPLDNMERRMVQETAERFADYNLNARNAQEPRP